MKKLYVNQIAPAVHHFIMKETFKNNAGVDYLSDYHSDAEG